MKNLKKKLITLKQRIIMTSEEFDKISSLKSEIDELNHILNGNFEEQ